MKEKKQKKEEVIKKEKTKKDKTEKNKNAKMRERVPEKEAENIKESKYHIYLWYLVIFSLIGLLIECIICYAVKIISKNEFGLLLGPMCFVYGIGAILTIICLQKFKGHRLKLFLLGIILGGTIQYVMSFILEAIFGAKLWNCAWSRFNLNGRLCLESAVIWGFATILIIEGIKKFIDKFIDKIQGKTRKIVDIILTFIIICTIMFTIWGIITYVIRAKESLEGKNYTSNNNIIEKFQNTAFANDIMEKIFPRIEIVDKEGNTILIKSINNK